MKTDFSLSNADLLLLFFCLFVHLVGFFLMHYGNSSIWAANITGYISFDWNKIILTKTDKQFLISYFYLQVNVNLVIVKRNENVLEVLFFILGQHLPNTDTINSHFQAAQLAFDSRHLVIAETYNKKFNWQTALSNRANRQHEAIQQRTLDFKKISVLKHGNIRRKSWVEIIGRWKCWKKKKEEGRSNTTSSLRLKDNWQGMTSLQWKVKCWSSRVAVCGKKQAVHTFLQLRIKQKKQKCSRTLERCEHWHPHGTWALWRFSD